MNSTKKVISMLAAAVIIVKSPAQPLVYVNCNTLDYFHFVLEDLCTHGVNITRCCHMNILEVEDKIHKGVDPSIDKLNNLGVRNEDLIVKLKFLYA